MAKLQSYTSKSKTTNRSQSQFKGILFFRILKQRGTLFDRKPAFTVMFYSHKQPLIDKMVGEKLLDKAIQLDEELDYEFVERLVKPYRKESSLIIIDDGIQKISKSLTKLFLEGKILQL